MHSNTLYPKYTNCETFSSIPKYAMLQCIMSHVYLTTIFHTTFENFHLTQPCTNEHLTQTDSSSHKVKHVQVSWIDQTKSASDPILQVTSSKLRGALNDRKLIVFFFSITRSLSSLNMVSVVSNKVTPCLRIQLELPFPDGWLCRSPGQSTEESVTGLSPSLHPSGTVIKQNETSIRYETTLSEDIQETLVSHLLRSIYLFTDLFNSCFTPDYFTYPKAANVTAGGKCAEGNVDHLLVAWRIRPAKPEWPWFEVTATELVRGEWVQTPAVTVKDTVGWLTSKI